ncbi:DUF308 domain-containing protein [Chloroflexota bacterium]
MSTDPAVQANEAPEPAKVVSRWWITTMRGVFALLLGVLLLLFPMATRYMILRFISLYWITSGLTSLMLFFSEQRAVAGQRAAIWLMAGLIGVIGGGAVFVQTMFKGLVTLETTRNMLGITTILTGLAHILGGFRTGDDFSRQWSWGSFFLGLMELILAVLLLSGQTLDNNALKFAVSAWAFISGIGLILQSLQLREAAHRATTPEARLD